MKTILTILLIVSIPSGDQIKQWCEQGQKCIENGDGISAAKYYNRCCESIGTGRSVIPLTSSLFNIAKIYKDAGDYQEAEKYIQRSIGLGMVLERTGSLVLRYQEASRIYSAMGRKEEALDYALKGLDLAFKTNNENTIGQIMLQAGDCYATLGRYDKSDSLYNGALEWLYKRGKGKIFVPEAYIKLGKNSQAKGDLQKARFYYESMLEKTHLGYDQLQMYEACKLLSGLLSSSDPDAASLYASMADSLDFAPQVEALGVNLALSNMEFPRRERETRIKAQREKLHLLMIIVLLCVVATILLCSNLAIAKKHMRETEEKNAALIKANLQKDALVSIAHAAVKETEELRRIAEDELPIPQVKLTKREIQIAHLAADGKLNKEIAEELGISIGTVGVHKNNLFRKLGIGNTVELLRYMQKVGL